MPPNALQINQLKKAIKKCRFFTKIYFYIKMFRILSNKQKNQLTQFARAGKSKADTPTK